MRTIRPRKLPTRDSQNAPQNGNDNDGSLFEADRFGWWHSEFHPSALELLDQGIEGVIRRSILQTLPAEELGKHFSPDQGRPTKELYAICGLLVMAEFRNWTIDETAAAWTFDARVHYALGLGHRRQFISPRTIDNYRRLFKEDDLASGIFEQVTAHLVKELGLEIKKQRLDSTHVLSHMAKFGRLKLLSTTTKRFLVNLQRHHPSDYEKLPSPIRERYQTSESRLFGQGSKNPEPHDQATQQVGEDMIVLIALYAANTSITKRSSYGALERAFHDHFSYDERDQTLKLRPKALGQDSDSRSVMQNSSDPEAGYSGHKGSGYQSQLNQAYDTGEGPGLITGCLVQPAGTSDSAALNEIIEQQGRMNTLPETQLADTAYGSQANVDASAEAGIELISPTPGKSSKTPISSPPKNAAAAPTTGAPTKTTASVEREEPPLSEQEKRARRREEETTKEWQQKYNKRSGVEGVHAAINRMTGFKKLRVRGMKAVRLAVYGKVAGYNMHLAARILKKRKIAAQKAAERHEKMIYTPIGHKKRLRRWGRRPYRFRLYITPYAITC